jgi:pyrroloquinoline-quinone synthase
MDVLARLDEARAATNVLEHPFYERWSAGTLSPTELSLYADQYRHAALALAQASARAAALSDSEHRGALERHAAEEAEHVALWDQFAEAAHACAGQDAGEPASRSARTKALEPTGRCAAAWTAGESLLEQMAVLYAIEAGQPQIASTKLQGLVEHYGYAAEGPAVEYFRLHERLDVEHARDARELISTLLDRSADAEATGDRMLTCAQRALRGNWELLSGVETTARPAAQRSASSPAIRQQPRG